MVNSNTGIQGIAHIQLLDENGDLKFEVVKKNLITTVGDEYYARMGAAGVGTGNSTPTLAARMHLGTGTGAVTKSGSGAHIASGTYAPSSNVTFDSVAVAAVGSDTGYRIRYTSTWGTGVAVSSALTEASIVTTTANSAAGAPATLARVTFTAVNKGANDTLKIEWDHIFFDAP